jgi:hypothetical protein
MGKNSNKNVVKNKSLPSIGYLKGDMYYGRHLIIQSYEPREKIKQISWTWIWIMINS